jgi:hypothetical protein
MNRANAECRGSDPTGTRSHLLIAVLAVVTSSGLAWDFEYGYRSVFSPNADTYVVDQSTVRKTDSGFYNFYQPIGFAGTVTYKFLFDAPVASAFLHANVAADYFPEQQGSAGLFASKDGQTWVNLLFHEGETDHLTVAEYDQELPSSVLGADQLWIQARMSGGFPFPEFAQFSRSDERLPTDVFQLKATLVPEPSITAFAVVFGIVMVSAIVRRRSLES